MFPIRRLLSQQIKPYIKISTLISGTVATYVIANNLNLVIPIQDKLFLQAQEVSSSSDIVKTLHDLTKEHSLHELSMSFSLEDLSKLYTVEDLSKVYSLDNLSNVLSVPQLLTHYTVQDITNLEKKRIFYNNVSKYVSASTKPVQSNKFMMNTTADEALEIILDPKKNVVVLFTAKNCPACVGINTVMEYVAESLSDRVDIQFIRMETYKNYIPGIQTTLDESSSPSIKIFPAGEHKRKEYEIIKSKCLELNQYNDDLFRNQLEKRKNNRNIPLITFNNNMKITSNSEMNSITSRPQLDTSIMGKSFSFSESKEYPLTCDKIFDFISQHTLKPYNSTIMIKRTPEILNDLSLKIIEQKLIHFPDVDDPILRIRLFSPACGYIMQEALNKQYLMRLGMSTSKDSILLGIKKYSSCIINSQNDPKEKEYWNELEDASQIADMLISAASEE